jgi:undecaprenyl-diphosphatase
MASSRSPGASDETDGAPHHALEAAVAALGVPADAEHPVAEAAVTALGGTPAGTERPAESPVDAVLPPGLAGLVRRFDVSLDRSFAGLRRNPRTNKAMFAASALGDFSLLWHLVGTARALRSPAHEREALRLGTSLLVESVLINGIVKSFFRRERPAWEQERTHALRKPRSSSFPSGHATSGFMAATLLANGNRRRNPFWYGLASVVAASRVHVRIHHPSDVVAGSLIGIGLGAAARRIWPLPR